MQIAARKNLETRTAGTVWQATVCLHANNRAGQQRVLDVHHGVRVLAGVGLGSTAGAGCNGHAMLPAGHVAPNWDIQGGVGVKEPKRLQKEAHMLSWHDGPILNPGNVCHPKRVPDDTVSFYQIPVLHSQHNIST